mmetsp:Transcript_15896/g.29067  ORF Transcript_15896/g.29067 Transcript_15896/m.29067 type:complete len:225 (-) Transcript_15896:12-686(-)
MAIFGRLLNAAPPLRCLPSLLCRSNVSFTSASSQMPAKPFAAGSLLAALQPVRCGSTASNRKFVKEVFGNPPQKATKRYSGVHMHPDRWRGYPAPIKRQGKVKPLPCFKQQPYDYHLGVGSNGGMYLMPPYPPRVNRTIPVRPTPDDRRNLWPTKVHKSYPLRWKNIEYQYEPALQRKPHGQGRLRYTGSVTRIEHSGKGKTSVTRVSHDARLLCNYDDKALLS